MTIFLDQAHKQNNVKITEDSEVLGPLQHLSLFSADDCRNQMLQRDTRVRSHSKKKKLPENDLQDRQNQMKEVSFMKYQSTCSGQGQL